jgi:protein TonB
VKGAVSLQLAIAALEDMMFADSLLESNFDRTHRGWTTFASFALQMMAVAVLLTLPLIYTEGLPKLHSLVLGAPIGPPPGRRPASATHSSVPHPPSNFRDGMLVRPETIAVHVGTGVEVTSPQDLAPCAVCVPGGPGLTSNANSVLRAIGTSPATLPPTPTAKARPPRISTMMEGNLIYKVQPLYPPLARSARIQGTVLLRAVISRTGTIENLQALSGPPMLIHAALDAVSQWRYRPYLLNGEPVEVETQVTVNFSLSGG